jgi:hypothetical protein
MKYGAFCSFLLALASSGCDAGRSHPRPAAQPASSSERRPAAEGDELVGRIGADDTPTDEAPRTPGGAIYGEVVAATDDIVAALDQIAADPPAGTAALRRAVQRFKAAARNWKIYLAHTSGAELTLLEGSQLARHAESSRKKLRESILRAARDPAADALRGELSELLGVWRESLSANEREEFER